jgi:hypothetical protein
VKRPEHEGVQIKLGLDSVEIRIWEISQADVVSNTEFNANKFHCVVPGIIKTEISSAGKFLL